MGTLTGLQDHVRLAREYTNEGIYDTSVIFFDGAIAQINKHLSTLDDPLIWAKWMNCKKALSDEIETVKQLDAERRALKEALGTRCPASPPFPTKSSFVFQPLDEYPNSFWFLGGGKLVHGVVNHFQLFMGAFHHPKSAALKVAMALLISASVILLLFAVYTLVRANVEMKGHTDGSGRKVLNELDMPGSQRDSPGSSGRARETPRHFNRDLDRERANAEAKVWGENWTGRKHSNATGSFDSTNEL